MRLVDIPLILLSIFVVIVMPYQFAKKSAEVECRLYNAQYHTNYTTYDFLWAGSTIKSFLNSGEQKTFNVKLETKQ